MAEQKLNAVGAPEPAREEPVAPHHPDKPRGERQDGAGAAAPRAERNDATPVGDLAASRAGPRQGIGGDDPFAGDRGDPAAFANGEARGAGAGAGGSDGDRGEDPDPDKGGGGRPHRG